jgi:ubiquinone/menaquinone biosynthesis C-methylase UbiE
MSNLAFNGMSFFFKLRYFLFPPRGILREVGIKPGFRVLDYGCGPGGYLLDTVELVGQSGTVYALDIHPLAVRKVQNIVKKKRLTNVKTICSGCQTGLPDNSIDVVLLYDVFHSLSEPHAVLAELYRVLKPCGILSFTADHMGKDKAISRVTSSRLFRLLKDGQKTLSFSKQGGGRSVETPR